MYNTFIKMFFKVYIKHLAILSYNLNFYYQHILFLLLDITYIDIHILFFRK